MKPAPLLILLLACTGCVNIPELEDSEAPGVRKAAYPRLIALQETLGPPVKPEDEAAEVEEELTQRKEALDERAKALQEVSID